MHTSRRRAGDNQHALEGVGGGQLHQADRDANVRLLLFPAVADPAAIRATHLPSLEVAEDRLDTRGLECVDVAKVSGDPTVPGRAVSLCRAIALKYTIPATSQRPGTACSSDEQSALRSSQRSEWPWPRSTSRSEW